MYCPSCGAENEEARPLCYRCGGSLRNLEPLQPRLPALRGQTRFLRRVLLSLAASMAVLAVALALLFSLTPDPRPLPTPVPTWQPPGASSLAIVEQPSPVPTAILPAGLTGRVLDASSQPLGNAQIMAGTRQAVADEQGNFAVAGLAPGQYVVAAIQSGYAPGLSPIVSLHGGETRNVDLVLYPAGESGAPLADALAPGGVSTEKEARRLAQEQGLEGNIVAVQPITLRGTYWLNYQAAAGLGAAVATLDEPGWAVTDDRGQAWRISGASGGLALPLPAGWALPAAGPSAPEDKAPTPAPAAENVPPPPPGQQPGAIQWSQPELIGGEGQGGPTEQLLRDRDGHIWAFWEEHISPGSPEHAYTAVYYRLWEGEAWGPLQTIPGSENQGEPCATLLADGTILLRTEPGDKETYSWFHWDGSQWAPAPEMSLPMPSGYSDWGLAADGYGLVHVMGYHIHTWDGASWHDTPILGTIYFHGTDTDTQGNLHAVGNGVDTAGVVSAQHWVWDGQSWSEPAIIHSFPSQVLPGEPAALAIGPDGTFHVAWAEGEPYTPRTGPTPPMPHWISYSHGTGTQWSDPEVIFGPVTVAGGFFATDLAVTADGTLVAAWGDVQLGTGARVYATWGISGHWAEPVVLSPEDGDSHLWAAVEVDGSGQVHVLWSSEKGVYHVIGSRSE